MNIHEFKKKQILIFIYTSPIIKMKNTSILSKAGSLMWMIPVIALMQGCNTLSETEADPGGFTTFELVKTSDIEPGGWVRQFLEFQRDGMTGHPSASGHPFNTGMWTERMRLDEKTENEMRSKFKRDGTIYDPDKGVFWWPYEQTGYYIDGAIKAGYLLGDSMLLNRTRQQVRYLIEHPQANGKLGPSKLLGRWFNWPYAGLFRSFMTEYQETGNDEILHAMLGHYHAFSAEDFQDELDVCNVEQLCWLFGITGDSSFLEMAERSYALFKSNHDYRNRNGKDIVFTSERIPDYHGVVYFEIVKIPAILYSVTGKQDYLDEALLGISKMEKHHMLVSGLPSTTELFHGISETAGHETCNLATQPYTYGIMLRITGETSWADRIEKAVFNAGLGAITKDFKAHQYFSLPNQMIATTGSHHLGYYPDFMAYAPGHSVSCCTGNINRMMPYYAMQMWMKTRDNGVAATLYGPSQISILAGKDNTPVKIIQSTRYPFDESIEFEIETKNTVDFKFQIRIPGWCTDPSVTLNGEQLKNEPVPGTFYVIDREFSNGDLIHLSLPMDIILSDWPNRGISFERGPVVYSYAVPDSTIIAVDYEKSTLLSRPMTCTLPAPGNTVL